MPPMANSAAAVSRLVLQRAAAGVAGISAAVICPQPKSIQAQQNLINPTNGTGMKEMQDPDPAPITIEKIQLHTGTAQAKARGLRRPRPHINWADGNKRER